MSLRILGGEFKNRPLKTPKSPQTRPTLAVMRKAVFDIVQSQIEGASFLDLYAGSGAMGLEALSRGACHTTFVETNPIAFGCIQENTRMLKLQEQSTLLSYDVLLCLKKMEKQARTFDLVYADPPYLPGVRLQLLQKLLEFFDSHPLLNKGGRLFLEEGAPPTLKLDKLSLTTLLHVDTRSFARSTLHQFRSIR